MTKKKSTTKKRKSTSRKSSSSKKQQSGFNRIITIVVTLGVIVLGLYYLVSGNDLLGLFNQEDEQQTQEPAETRPAEPTETKTTESADKDVAPPSVGGSGGDWWQVYFTDPHTVNDPENLAGSIPEKLIELINNAQNTIHIASFEFNLTPVAEALIVAHERGVDVKWVTDDEHGLEADEEDDHGQFAMLEDAGIEVKDDQRSALMHNKFWIFDNQTLWTGSTNITRNGGFRNNNNVIIIESPEVATIYETEFQEMWAGEFGPRSTSTLADQQVTIDGTPIQILFAAEDEVVTELVPLIESAQDNIRFMAFSFTHDDLGQAVLNRVKAGVDVQGIFETRGSETEYSELTALFCADVPVRQDGNPGTFHHKVFIIDGKMVLTGSLNFSNNADDSNDENIMVITNSDIATLYLQEFDRRWAEAKEPDPNDLVCG